MSASLPLLVDENNSLRNIECDNKSTLKSSQLKFLRICRIFVKIKNIVLRSCIYMELIIPLFSVKWNYVFQNNKYTKK